MDYDRAHINMLRLALPFNSDELTDSDYDTDYDIDSDDSYYDYDSEDSIDDENAENPLNEIKLTGVKLRNNLSLYHFAYRKYDGILYLIIKYNLDTINLLSMEQPHIVLKTDNIQLNTKFSSRYSFSRQIRSYPMNKPMRDKLENHKHILFNNHKLYENERIYILALGFADRNVDRDKLYESLCKNETYELIIKY